MHASLNAWARSELPAAERAYLSLKQDILAGSVRGGELLSEVEVGAPLGISRTPVHEAFLRLQAEGLLRLLPCRGAVVAAGVAMPRTAG